jgi:cystathionine beta-lyase/cystathionine gamma-synthase
MLEKQKPLASGVRLQTLLTHEPGERPYGAVAAPLYLNSLFTFDSFEQMKNNRSRYVCPRMGNPAAESLEQKLAALEGGEAAKVFASGMAAISTVLFHYLKQGDHIICSYPVYGGMYAFLSQILQRYGVEYDFVDFRRPEQVRASIRANTRLLYTEGYSTMFMDIFDLRPITAIAKEHGLISVIDNTCATPATLKPLAWGFDAVIHSLSKYLSGHSDLVGGAVISDKATIEHLTKIEVSLIGTTLAPFEAWLVNLSLRTFALRMKQHAESAMLVAQRLQEHPKVSRVNFPFLPMHEQHSLARKQFASPTGLLSFELTGGAPMVQRFIDSLRLVQLGVGWGGFESLVYAPAIGWQREQMKGSEYEDRVNRLVRLSVGLEDPRDLLEDIEQALNKA